MSRLLITARGNRYDLSIDRCTGELRESSRREFEGDRGFAAEFAGISSKFPRNGVREFCRAVL
jgi:hypothetical protein